MGGTSTTSAYFSPFTEVLGKLRCKTSWNVLGIGEAEWHWKVTKQNKGGQRANQGAEKTNKQAAIPAAYSHEKLALCWWANQKAGKFYEERISSSMIFGRKGRGLPFVCLEHGIKTGSHCSSRALEMIGLQWH